VIKIKKRFFIRGKEASQVPKGAEVTRKGGVDEERVVFNV